MELAMSAAVPSPASPADAALAAQSERAQEFARLVQSEPLRENFYADAAASSSQASNPVASAMAQFDQVDFLPELLQAERSAPEPGMSIVDEFRMANNDMLLLQAELLRMTLLCETVSSAKQGVTTLFQQQG